VSTVASRLPPIAALVFLPSERLLVACETGLVVVDLLSRDCHVFVSFVGRGVTALCVDERARMAYCAGVHEDESALFAVDISALMPMPI
jgi:hypothetical protein